LDTLDDIAEAQRTSRWPWRRIFIANALGLLTALSREAYGPAFVGIFGAYLIAVIFNAARMPWREGSLVALSCLGAGLYGIYMLVAYRVIPLQRLVSAESLYFARSDRLPWGLCAIVDSRDDRSMVGAESRITCYVSRIIPHCVADRRTDHGLSSPGRQSPHDCGLADSLCIFGAYALLRLIDSQVPLRRTIALGALALSAISDAHYRRHGACLRQRAHPPLYQSADQLATLDWLATTPAIEMSYWRIGVLATSCQSMPTRACSSAIRSKPSVSRKNARRLIASSIHQRQKPVGRS